MNFWMQRKQNLHGELLDAKETKPSWRITGCKGNKTFMEKDKEKKGRNRKIE